MHAKDRRKIAVMHSTCAHSETARRLDWPCMSELCRNLHPCQIMHPLLEIATWLPNPNPTPKPNPSPTPNPKPTNTRGCIIWQGAEFGTTAAGLTAVRLPWRSSFGLSVWSNVCALPREHLFISARHTPRAYQVRVLMAVETQTGSGGSVPNRTVGYCTDRYGTWVKLVLYGHIRSSAFNYFVNHTGHWADIRK